VQALLRNGATHKRAVIKNIKDVDVSYERIEYYFTQRKPELDEILHSLLSFCIHVA